LKQEKLTIVEALCQIDRSDTRIVDVDDTEYTSILLHSCDPEVHFDNDNDFVHFWTEIQRALDGMAIDQMSFEPIDEYHNHDLQ
jgi:hypothetical protein